MTKEKQQAFIAFISILTVAGFVLLFFSVNFGMALANNWLTRQGGADTSTYLIVMEGYTNSFLAAGSILSGIGLVSFILIFYKFFNIDK